MKTLIVITGPTGSGKSGLAIELARALDCDIVSADSRQIYHGLRIGTAAPTDADLAAVRHHFVGTLDLDAPYSAAQFEADVMELLPQLWEKGDYVVMCGGSMLYVDAIINGIDDIPTISEQSRSRAMAIFETGGIEALRTELQRIDPEHYSQVDINNPRRLVHAIEVCYESGVTFSSLRTGRRRERPFCIVAMAINHSREELFNRINRRVEAMMADGLEAEARSVSHLRHLNSLNTVGYKEMFALFDGIMDRPTAVARLAKNTRVYAKKQMLWLRHHPEIALLDPHADLLRQALDIVRAAESNSGSSQK